MWLAKPLFFYLEDSRVKLVWEEDEVASGFPVENAIVSKNESGKIISVVAVAWFGLDNANANEKTQDIVDGLQAVVAGWSEKKLGPAPGGAKK
jgi:hypothetical protein